MNATATIEAVRALAGIHGGVARKKAQGLSVKFTDGVASARFRYDLHKLPVIYTDSLKGGAITYTVAAA
jgi:hypothetical protein